MEMAEDIGRRWQSALLAVAQAHGISDTSTSLEAELESVTMRAVRERGMRSSFLVLTAPTGVGKTTVGHALEGAGIRRLPRINTRLPRPGEVEGRDYYFVTQEEYNRRREAGELLCPTSSTDNFAAIPRSELLEEVARRRFFYIDAGAGTARTIKGEPALAQTSFLLCFLLPPSFRAMIERAEARSATEQVRGGSRGTLTPEWLLRRLEQAVSHLAESVYHADVYAVNDTVARATREILSLVP